MTSGGRCASCIWRRVADGVGQFHRRAASDTFVELRIAERVLHPGHDIREIDDGVNAGGGGAGAVHGGGYLRPLQSPEYNREVRECLSQRGIGAGALEAIDGGLEQR